MSEHDRPDWFSKTKEAVVGSRRPIVYSHCHLKLSSGPSAGAEVETAKDTVRIGSAPDNDLVVEDDMVSRHHLELRKVQGAYNIFDLGSTNGTFIGALEIKEAALHKKSEISIGDTTIQFEPRSTEFIAEPSGLSRCGQMVASSLSMRRIFTVIERVAPTELAILVTGDPGTGKEAVARAVHAQSPRRDGPFVTLALRALPPKLLESALFGHEAHAVDGAEEAYPGAFERANGGTLFLDDLETLPEALQTRLDRAIERSEITRLGGARQVRVDVRLVAAAPSDIGDRVDRGELLSALYYRLGVIQIDLPPLIDRTEDIPELVQDFFETQKEELERLGALARRLSPAALKQLERYAFPGNVRELINILHQAATFAREEEILVDDLPPEVLGTKRRPVSGIELPDASMRFKDAKAALLDVFERQYLEDLMRRHEQNISKAAREAGIDRRHLYRLLDKYGIDVKDKP